MKNRAVISAIVMVVVFLAGFVPQYAKVNHLDAELRQARLGNTSAELRDLVGLAYVQANQKNYGIAAATTARFFSRVRELANQTPDANARKTYQDLLISHDKITAELAKGEAGVMGDLQDLVVKTRKATGASAEQLAAVAARTGPDPAFCAPARRSRAPGRFTNGDKSRGAAPAGMLVSG